MAELKKPVMLNETGLAIDQDLKNINVNTEILVTNVGDIGTKLEGITPDIHGINTSSAAINTTLDTRGGEIVEQLKEISKLKYVANVVKKGSPTESLVDDSRVAHVPTNVTELDDYNVVIRDKFNLIDSTLNDTHTEIVSLVTRADNTDTHFAKIEAAKFYDNNGNTVALSQAWSETGLNINSLLVGGATGGLTPDFGPVLEHQDISSNETIVGLQNQLTGVGGVQEKLAEANTRIDVTNQTVQNHYDEFNRFKAQDFAILSTKVGGIETTVANHTTQLAGITAQFDAKADKFEVGNGLTWGSTGPLGYKTLLANIDDGLKFNASNGKLQVQGITCIQNTAPEGSNSGAALQFVILNKSEDDPTKRYPGYIYIYTE